MLDAYIIDAIRKEQEEREQEFELRRVQLELPIEMPDRSRRMPPPSIDDGHGPVVIPLYGPSVEDDAA